MKINEKNQKEVRIAIAVLILLLIIALFGSCLASKVRTGEQELKQQVVIEDAEVIAGGINPSSKPVQKNAVPVKEREIKTMYSVVVLPTTEGGEVSVDVISAQPGDIIEVTVVTQQDYILDTVTVNNEPILGTSFKMPNKDVKVSARFRPYNSEEVQYRINKKDCLNGGFELSKQAAPQGELIEVLVTPHIGYKLDYIMVNDIKLEEGQISFKMPSKLVIVEVVFKKIIFNVTQTASVNGSFSIDKFTASIDEEIVITPVPAIGYEVDTITTTNGIVNGNIVTSQGTGDVEITVTFKKIGWQVIKEPTINGSFTIDKTSARIGEGISVDATPDVGYALDTITATNAIIDGNTATSQGTGDIKITVTFKKLVWAVTKEATTNGSFTIDKTSVSIGDVITVDVTPAVGYTLDTITATNSTVSKNTVTSQGTDDIKITVTFKKLVWIVTKETTTNGSFTIDKTSVSIGDVITVDVTPDVGYTFDTITATNATVDGKTVASIGTGDIKITVTFEKLVWNVTKEATVNGSFTLDKTKVSVGDVITITATPNRFCAVDTITATNATIVGNTAVSSGEGDVTISVSFKAIKGYCAVTYVSNKYATISGSVIVPHNTVLTVNYIENDVPNTYMRGVRDENGTEYAYAFNVGTKNSITLNPVICKTSLVRIFNAGGISDVGGFWGDDQYKAGTVSISTNNLSVRSTYMAMTYMGRIHSNNRVNISKMVYEQVQGDASAFWSNISGQDNYGGLQPFTYASVASSSSGIRRITSPISSNYGGSATSALVCVTISDSKSEWRSVWHWNIWNKTDIEVTDTLVAETKIINTKNQRNIKSLPTINGEFSVQSTAIENEKVTINFVADSGYKLEYIKVNGDVIVGTTFVMPGKDVEVEVLFTHTDK